MRLLAMGGIAAACGLGLAIAVAVAAEEGSQTPSLLAEQGAALFERHCAVCHGEGGRGDGPAAPALRKAPADLTRIAARRGGTFPEAEVARIVDGRFDLPAHGSREMPVWGVRLGEDVPEEVAQEFVRGRIDMLVAHLRSLQREAD